MEADPDTWEIHYLDTKTNIKWVSYYPYEEDRSPEFIRRADFPSELGEMLKACFGSTDKFDWYGLGAHLSSKKYDIHELLKYLEENKKKIPKKALKEFGKAYRPQDTRNIIGMKYDEVCSSFEDFKRCVEEIKAITK